MKTAKRRAFAFATFAIAGLAACENTSSPSLPKDQVMAPGVDLRAAAKQDSSEAVEAGHRMIAAGEYELALRAFNRAALSRGALDAEILSGLGTANLGLGRLGQAEELLRRAVRDDAAQPVDYNNLGVLLMEQGNTAEALQYFRRAFALSNGENIAIRDNLRLALAKTENSATLEAEKSSEYKLVRRGNSDFVIRPTP
ncbi:tetratricopeptide repeat protein [Roseobacter denitrificans]|uniref:TPR domain protein n=1 Tax=Roseobacter denitrificans (strain ATCC 33942 / OCh 114) TaxID=375451 RepID=Q167Y2_ROSDO|nr:tetratricopeptide repeat protein [Roseobacter denitrificans]ABG31711.1 TPR domain protein [Roseobacter denitrificans OCh 114]AVL51302.1 tetratricopeptide repeat protein [Roseobacter denitrificans]SFF87982.1 Tetratricopeptide repeat-containing protein [Roseobacter denitrificans OCh 114]